MPKTMTLDARLQQRIVVLRMYPEQGEIGIKAYIDSEGVSHPYHTVEVRGPYANNAAVTAQINDVKFHHELWIENGIYMRWGNEVPELTILREYSMPEWKPYS